MHSVFMIHDFETGSRKEYNTQPVQWAACAIDSRTLDIVDEFETKIRPFFTPEECELHCLAELEDDALYINGHSRESLASAPPIKLAWENIIKWVEGVSPKTGTFNGPIRVGFNSPKFDDVILDRIMGGHFYQIRKLGFDIPEEYKEPYGFGPWNSEREEQKLFNFKQFDIMQQVFSWLENINRPNRYKYNMDTLREYFGLPKQGAHDAKIDVRQEAEIFVRFLKYARKRGKNLTFENSMAESIFKV